MSLYGQMKSKKVICLHWLSFLELYQGAAQRDSFYEFACISMPIMQIRSSNSPTEKTSLD